MTEISCYGVEGNIFPAAASGTTPRAGRRRTASKPSSSRRASPPLIPATGKTNYLINIGYADITSDGLDGYMGPFRLDAGPNFTSGGPLTLPQVTDGASNTIGVLETAGGNIRVSAAGSRPRTATATPSATSGCAPTAATATVTSRAAAAWAGASGQQPHRRPVQHAVHGRFRPVPQRQHRLPHLRLPVRRLSGRPGREPQLTRGPGRGRAFPFSRSSKESLNMIRRCLAVAAVRSCSPRPSVATARRPPTRSRPATPSRTRGWCRPAGRRRPGPPRGSARPARPAGRRREPALTVRVGFLDDPGLGRPGRLVFRQPGRTRRRRCRPPSPTLPPAPGRTAPPSRRSRSAARSSSPTTANTVGPHELCPTPRTPCRGGTRRIRRRRGPA